MDETVWCSECRTGGVVNCDRHGEFSDYGRLQPRWLGPALACAASLAAATTIVWRLVS